MSERDLTAAIAADLSLPGHSVAAVITLLEDGSTVPFIARYRKEATGSLDEVQIRAVDERLAYRKDLEQRRASILESVEGQGKLSDDLRRALLLADTKARLEDLYLPYKPKRRTRAIMARERGLGPLADRLLEQPASGSPDEEAAAYVKPDQEVPDVAAALQGARDIAAEKLAEQADARAVVREAIERHGAIVSSYAKPPTGPTKFDQYGDFGEPLAKIPSHRFLALRRGEKEGVLRTRVEVDTDPLLPRLEGIMGLSPRSPWAPHLAQAVRDGVSRLLRPSVETDVLVELKMQADRTAVAVFADNLRDLLLSAPLGGRSVLGVDPGLRTGCKCVVVDDTGKYLENTTLFLSQGEGRKKEAAAILGALLEKHRPAAVAVGNGTGGREAEAFVRACLAGTSFEKEVWVVPVNEAGASVYSASDVAREEHPDLDVTVRGAVSIARRLQDPLAELVKIDPKAIGVGQYQHDVYQALLAKKLDEVVESCVNHVGVEVNTASAPLLSRVAGIGAKVARRIVEHRDGNGPFTSRKALLSVSGLGPATYQQCAGFLRVRGGAHLLDASAVHPERYGLVETMARDLGVELASLIGDTSAIDRIELERYVDGDVGEPTLRDIVGELKKPGRDPRERFEPPRFRDDVNSLEDLRAGMELEGVVTNVTAFGAFVDVGVHQDGLVHISQLADRFVKDAHDVVKAGDKLKVRVLEVDLERRRIALSAKRNDAAPAPVRGSAPAPARKAPSFQRAPGAQAPQSGQDLKHNPFAQLRPKS
jgi:protein Tex